MQICLGLHKLPPPHPNYLTTRGRGCCTQDYEKSGELPDHLCNKFKHIEPPALKTCFLTFFDLSLVRRAPENAGSISAGYSRSVNIVYT